MADDSIHEQLLEPEVILTVRQEVRRQCYW